MKVYMKWRERESERERITDFIVKFIEKVVNIYLLEYVIWEVLTLGSN